MVFLIFHSLVPFFPVTYLIQIHFRLAWAAFVAQKLMLISGYFESLW